MADTTQNNTDIKATTPEAVSVAAPKVESTSAAPQTTAETAPATDGTKAQPVVEGQATTKTETEHAAKPNQGPLEAEDWVAVAFVVFAVLFFAKVFPKIQAMLDARSTKIAHELSEARILRDEAAKLYADAKRKSAEAEVAAVEMIQTAKAEAKRIAEKAEVDMNEEAARKMVIVENKIKRAEQQAIESVKKEAVEEATKIATKLLTAGAAKNHKSLLSESIAKITSSIN